MLTIKDLKANIDNKEILKGLNLEIKPGEVHAIMGPNGSGKSTILNTISNLVSHKNGSIHFKDNLISEIPTFKRTELGISHVLERRRVFPHLTVIQNLILGAWHPKAKKELSSSLSKVYKIFPKLESRSSQLAHTMSGGEQQMLAIARGLMGLPKLLMVDEPFLGLSPLVVKDLIKIFKNVVSEGISILFVEQNVRLALSMADRGYVLESGRLVISGKYNELINNEKVKKVFLGS